MRVLITGVDGFIGSWLTEALVSVGDEVVGLSRRRGDAQGGAVRHRVDVTDGAAVAELVHATKPERIFHLAAQSNVARSFAQPAETLAINVVGSAHLFEAVRAHAAASTIVSVGSSSEYGETARTTELLVEDAALCPTSPYGVSKVSQGKLAAVYARAHGMRVVHVRPFAIVGPRKEGDALSDFCRNVAAIEKGMSEALSVGNTSAVRDFVDVRDCVRALRLVADMGVAGDVYNICGERPTSLDDVIELLQQTSRARFEVRRDPNRIRPVDDLRVVGSGAKLRALGFATRFSLADTIAATLDHWRTRS